MTSQKLPLLLVVANISSVDINLDTLYKTLTLMSGKTLLKIYQAVMVVS